MMQCLMGIGRTQFWPFAIMSCLGLQFWRLDQTQFFHSNLLRRLEKTDQIFGFSSLIIFLQNLSEIYTKQLVFSLILVYVVESNNQIERGIVWLGGYTPQGLILWGLSLIYDCHLTYCFFVYQNLRSNDPFLLSVPAQELSYWVFSYVHSLMCYEYLSETINPPYKPKILEESSRINNTLNFVQL